MVRLSEMESLISSTYPENRIKDGDGNGGKFIPASPKTSTQEKSLETVKQLLAIYENYPNTLLSAILRLIHDVTYADANSDVQEQEVEEEEEIEEEPEPEKYYYRKHHKDDRRELIGTVGTVPYKTHEKYDNNPYGIPIGTYEECPRCKKVGLSSMSVSRYKDTTIVCHKLLHDQGDCNIRKEQFSGHMEWDEITAYKKKHPQVEDTT